MELPTPAQVRALMDVAGPRFVAFRTYSHLGPTAEDRTRKATAALMTETLGPAERYADSLRTKEA